MISKYEHGLLSKFRQSYDADAGLSPDENELLLQGLIKRADISEDENGNMFNVYSLTLRGHSLLEEYEYATRDREEQAANRKKDRKFQIFIVILTAFLTAFLGAVLSALGQVVAPLVEFLVG